MSRNGCKQRRLRQLRLPELGRGVPPRYDLREMAEIDWDDLIERYDRGRMRDVLAGFPDQCRQGIEIGHRFRAPVMREIDEVVVCGMGGSAMAGEVARRFARLPVFVNRGYALPGFVNERTLLVAVSYSGNTAETLSALAQGLDRKIPTLCIASGGRMRDEAKRFDVPCVEIPVGCQPRMAAGYLALPLLSILAQMGLLKIDARWEALLRALERMRAFCEPEAAASEDRAQGIAEALFGKVPVIYGTADNTDLVAMRWKTEINENSKQAAFWNVFPELNHNEIVSLGKPELVANQHVVFLHNSHDLRENVCRMEISRGLFARAGVACTDVRADGDDELSEVFSQIYRGDYVSFYLALLNQVDPTPVRLIEDFKKELEERLKLREGIHD